MIEHLNKILGYAAQHGFTKVFETRSLRIMEMKFNVPVKTTSNTLILSIGLNELYFIFFIYVTGNIISFFLFLLEYLVYHYI